jgi:hypothetical protein
MTQLERENKIDKLRFEIPIYKEGLAKIYKLISEHEDLLIAPLKLERTLPRYLSEYIYRQQYNTLKREINRMISDLKKLTKT